MRSMKAMMRLGVVLACMLAADGLAEDMTPAAVQAAQSWLMLVDAGEYGKSWDRSAALFKGALSRNAWEQSLSAARKPMGAVIARKLVSAQYTTTLPGAPDGEYVVIQFDTRFANKKSAVETVTPMKDADGVWRVSGYYIK